MNAITINKLRLVSFIEGISFIALLFVGMPLKYGFDILIVNKILGMTHGVLTMIFCAILFLVWKSKQLNSSWCLGVFFASLIPFGAFFAEIRLKRFQSTIKNA